MSNFFGLKNTPFISLVPPTADMSVNGARLMKSAVTRDAAV